MEKRFRRRYGITTAGNTPEPHTKLFKQVTWFFHYWLILMIVSDLICYKISKIEHSFYLQSLIIILYLKFTSIVIYVLFHFCLFIIFSYPRSQFIRFSTARFAKLPGDEIPSWRTPCGHCESSRPTNLFADFLLRGALTQTILFQFVGPVLIRNQFFVLVVHILRPQVPLSR